MSDQYLNQMKQEHIKLITLEFETTIMKLAMSLAGFQERYAVHFNPDVEKYIGLAVSQATTLQATMIQASKSIKEIEK